MTTELRARHNAQQHYASALASLWRSSQFFEPSVWLQRDPEAEEKMLRDANIGHAVGFRRMRVAGNQWQLTARDAEDERAKLACDVGTKLLGHLKRFTDGRAALARAFFSGSRFAKIHGATTVLTLGDGRPRTWWVPTHLEDLDKRSFRVVPDAETKTVEWQQLDLITNDYLPETAEDRLRMIRHVYQDDQGSVGFGRALREPLAWCWYASTNINQHNLRAIEKFAGGTLHAKVAGARDASSDMPNTELIRAWIQVLEEMRASNAIVSDASDDISLMDANGEGHQIMSEMRGDLRSMVFTLVLGAHLPTAAPEGGSYALADVQENSTESIVTFDRESLSETLSESLMRCMWIKNAPNLRELGLSHYRPRFSIGQQKNHDPQEQATAASTLNGMGVDLSAEDVYEKTGFRRPEAEEDVIAGRAETPSLPGVFGGPS